MLTNKTQNVIFAPMKTMLKDIRRKLNLSQQDLAEKTRRSQSCISAYENNSRSMDIDFAFEVIEIAKNMGIDCSLNDLYERD